MVETEGDGPLLLLAGLGPTGSHVIFHPFFAGMARTHRVIYVALYGRGRSDRPADLADVTFRSDVAGIAALDLGPTSTPGWPGKLRTCGTGSSRCWLQSPARAEPGL